MGLEVKSSTYTKDRIFALKLSRSPYFDNYRKYSYLHHRHLVWLAFIPRYWTQGSMPGEVELGMVMSRQSVNHTFPGQAGGGGEVKR